MNICGAEERPKGKTENKIAGHTIPKLPAKSQETLMVFVNLRADNTFQIKRNRIAALLEES